MINKTVCLTCPKSIRWLSCASFKKYKLQNIYLILYKYVLNQIPKRPSCFFLPNEY